MNNCRVQIKENADKTGFILMIDALNKETSEWFTIERIIEGEELEQYKNLLKVINNK